MERGLGVGFRVQGLGFRVWGFGGGWLYRDDGGLDGQDLIRVNPQPSCDLARETAVSIP